MCHAIQSGRLFALVFALGAVHEKLQRSGILHPALPVFVFSPGYQTVGESYPVGFGLFPFLVFPFGSCPHLSYVPGNQTPSFALNSSSSVPGLILRQLCSRLRPLQ